MKRVITYMTNANFSIPVLFKKQPIKLYLYKASGFRKYGLLRDDILDEDEIVTEALRRLHPDVLAERNFRIIRAGYLCMRKDVLPEEEWTQLENDVLYLQPFIKQVEEELAEKEQWELE